MMRGAPISYFGTSWDFAISTRGGGSFTIPIYGSFKSFSMTPKHRTTKLQWAFFLLIPWKIYRVSQKKRTNKTDKKDVFDNLEPFWAHLDTFGPFLTKVLYKL